MNGKSLKTKYNTLQFTLYSSLNSISHFIRGPGGTRWQTPCKWLSMPHLSTTSVGPTSGCVILVTVSGWLFQPPCHCWHHSCICCEPTQKIRKGQQYLFLFNNFWNKILKHSAYIWYYTTGSLTITRHDKSYSWVLEYMYYMPKLSNYPTLIGLPH